MSKYRIGFLLALLGVFLSSCGGLDGQISFVMKSTQSTVTPLVSFTPSIEPSPALTPTITPTPTNTPPVVFGPDPQQIAFTSIDGELLKGMYYPASENPAPVIVLMHWARGDQEDWSKVAVWLQDRVELDLTPDYNRSWRSADWYPENNREKPIGVFTFNFRDCEGECKSYLPGDWLLDARSAMIAVSRLSGVDKNRIITAGASIGADGAIDGCAWFNQKGLGTCLGSYVLSPGSFLTEPFEDAVGVLVNDVPPHPVYCLYGLRDDSAIESCSEIAGIKRFDHGYITNHGMELLQPLQDPDPLTLMLELVDEALWYEVIEGDQ